MVTLPIGYTHTRFANATTGFSPMTLSHEWPMVVRCLGISLLGMFGIISNFSFVSAFYTDSILKTYGFGFLIGSIMSDSVISLLMVLSSTLTLIHRRWDASLPCRILYFFVIDSVYCFHLFFALAALERCVYTCCSKASHAIVASYGTLCICGVATFVYSFLASLGVILDLDYDYCERTQFGNTFFMTTSFIIFHMIPFLITILSLLATTIRVIRDRKKPRDAIQHSNIRMLIANVVAYFGYLSSWAVYTVIVYRYPGAKDSVFYYAAWFGISRSVFGNLVYCAIHPGVRLAYAKVMRRIWQTLTRRTVQEEVVNIETNPELGIAMNVFSPVTTPAGTPLDTPAMTPESTPDNTSAGRPISTSVGRRLAMRQGQTNNTPDSNPEFIRVEKPVGILKRTRVVKPVGRPKFTHGERPVSSPEQMRDDQLDGNPEFTRDERPAGSLKRPHIVKPVGSPKLTRDERPVGGLKRTRVVKRAASPKRPRDDRPVGIPLNRPIDMRGSMHDVEHVDTRRHTPDVMLTSETEVTSGGGPGGRPRGGSSDRPLRTRF